MLVPVVLLLVNYIVGISAQSNSYIKCDIYSASNTDSANQNYQLCVANNVCPGVKLVIGDCSSTCVGDQYIRLFDSSNTNEILNNDDGNCESPLDLCSRMEYVYSGPSCTSVTIRQGCYDNTDCGGRIKVTYIYTASPTYAPSTLPSGVPTYSPSAKPSSSPTTNVVLGPNDSQCLPYSIVNSNNARANFAVCNFEICPGTVLTVGDCGDSCSGDQFIRLFDSSNNLVMYDDDGCDDDPYAFCSRLTYVYRSGVCQTFSLHQGCYEGDECGGTMTINKATTPAPSTLPTAVPTSKPSAEPTANPTAVPSANPTAQPTSEPTAQPSAEPTAVPSAKPSAEPTAVPSAKPSAEPTANPTAQPSANPTAKPSAEPTAKPSAEPTAVPSAKPSAEPTASPSTKPTAEPTVIPTAVPSANPTAKPSAEPTAKPSAEPTAVPSAKPSAEPTAQPSAKPTSEPTFLPTAKPSSVPTVKPTSEPTFLPTAKPSSVPTPAPTQYPETGFATTDIVISTPVLQTVWYRAKYVGVVLEVNDCTWNYSDDATCQAAYPGAQIITIYINNLPVKLAIGGERRAPSTPPTVAPSGLPTLAPSAAPTLNPSTKPSWFPTLFPIANPTNTPTLFPVANPTGFPIAVSGCGPNGESCASLNWVYKDYTNHRAWAWVSPCSGGCSTPITTGVRGYNMVGWRFPNNADWALRPPQSAWNSGSAIACASVYFDPNYTHCDYVNSPVQYLDNSSNEIWFVHDM